MRPWAEHLAAAGFSVQLPRMPGHGTTWQDMSITRWADWLSEADRAFGDLTAVCTDVFVAGLSMGGSLALRLAETRGAAVRGLVLVNPAVHSENKAVITLPLLKHLLPSLKSPGTDIKMPDQDYTSYDRVPLKALHSLTAGWIQVRADIAKVDQPLLLFRSATDHVVEVSNGAWLLDHICSTDLEERVLHESFHVATLDNDAPEIFAGSVDFIHRLAPATSKFS
jgi:carboxylesterase